MKVIYLPHVNDVYPRTCRKFYFWRGLVTIYLSFHMQAGNGQTATLSLSPAHFNMQKIYLCLPVILPLKASLSLYSQKQEAPDMAL